MTLVEKIRRSVFIVTDPPEQPEADWYRIDYFDSEAGTINYHNERTGEEFQRTFAEVEGAKFFSVIEIR